MVFNMDVGSGLMRSLRDMMAERSKGESGRHAPYRGTW